MSQKYAVMSFELIKFWPKNAQFLEIDFGKPQKLENFPLP